VRAFEEKKMKSCFFYEEKKSEFFVSVSKLKYFHFAKNENETLI